MEKKILVLGASGFIGQHLLEQLQRQDAKVTVPTRRVASARDLWHLPGVTVLEMDVTRTDDLTDLLAGHDAVINLLGMRQGRAADYDRVQVQLVERLVEACRRSNVRRLIHVSSLGADKGAASLNLRTKARAEEILQDAAGDLEITLLRPSLVYGSRDRFLNILARRQRSWPFIFLSNGRTRLQPVWVRDVAEALARCVDDRGSIGQIYELGGPDILTLRELVHSAGQWAGAGGGKGSAIIGISSAVARPFAAIAHLLPGGSAMRGDLQATFAVDHVLSGTYPGLGELGVAAASLPAVIPVYLGSDGPAGRLDSYRRVARR